MLQVPSDETDQRPARPGRAATVVMSGVPPAPWSIPGPQTALAPHADNTRQAPCARPVGATRQPSRNRRGGLSGRSRRGAACRAGRCCRSMRVVFPGEDTHGAAPPQRPQRIVCGPIPAGRVAQGQPVANVGGLPGNAGGKTLWCATVVSRSRQTPPRSPLFPKRKLRPPRRNQWLPTAGRTGSTRSLDRLTPRP